MRSVPAPIEEWLPWRACVQIRNAAPILVSKWEGLAVVSQHVVQQSSSLSRC